MSLKKLFTNINIEYILRDSPHTNIKRILENYNNNDWMKYIQHQIDWFNNPILKQDNHIKTPILKDNSDYFEMFIVGFPPSYKTNIHGHNNENCYFKVLKGTIMENRYLEKNNTLMYCNLLYNNSPTSNISHIQKKELHSIQNTSKEPTFTLNIYSKK